MVPMTSPFSMGAEKSRVYSISTVWLRLRAMASRSLLVPMIFTVRVEACARTSSGRRPKSASSSEKPDVSTVMGFSLYSSSGVMLTNWLKPYSISFLLSDQRPDLLV